jgi:lipopolysaccharide transport system ATP-binding protein
LAAVSQFCSRAILLYNGVAASQGIASDVIDTYLGTQASDLQAELLFPDRPDRPASFSHVCTRNDKGDKTAQFTTSDAVTLEIAYVVRQPLIKNIVWLTLERVDGVRITKASEDEDRCPPNHRTPGRKLMQVRLPGSILNAGVYRFQIMIGEPRVREHDHQWTNFFQIDEIGSGTNLCMNSQRGVIRLPLKWHEECVH